MLEAVNILLVDDDPSLLLILSSALSSGTWNTISFHSASEAVASLSSHPYSALIVDAVPGYQALVSKFRERNPHSPIVLLTAGVSLEDETRTLNAGADLILLKPVGLSVLRQHVLDLIAVANQRAATITVFDLELREVMEVEKRLADANLNGDMDVLNELLSDDYVFAFGSQKETKPERLQAIRLGRLRYTKIEPLRIEGRHYADLCIFSGSFHIEGTRDGKSITGIYDAMRIYSRKKGKWKAVAGQMSPQIFPKAIA